MVRPQSILNSITGSIALSVVWLVSTQMSKQVNAHNQEQAGTELGQAQLQLELGFTLIGVCCITLMITNYHYIS